MQAIEIKNLVKKYGNFTAVNGVSFEVKKGEIFGFLGPNGAGKTTTLEIIEGLRQPTSGGTSVLGVNTQNEVEKVKEKIGVQLQQSAFFDYLTLEELLDLFGRFYEKRLSSEEVLKKVDLTDKKKSYVKELSGGQKQRFSIALSLVNDPEILFLDEPTTGIDPQSRHYLWNIIRALNKEEKTIVLTTHFMDEAQTLCDRIAIIDNGKIIKCDTPAKIIADAKIPFKIRIAMKGNKDSISKIKGILDYKEIHDGENCHEFRIVKIGDLQSILRQLEDKGTKITNLEVRSANLEDVFLELTGKELRE